MAHVAGLHLGTLYEEGRELAQGLTSASARLAKAALSLGTVASLVSASDRESRLEEVRSAFLASYSRTIGLKAVPPSPSGAIGGLLEQFVRGVGLRGSSTL
ncbi:myotubularin-related protein 14 [Limosa lapponica baueri]|uniref:Myotubularin-related protein 14 n=1 Tax=Limosa lapponica baueri TaxID=1758121 RepID=A0A2I0TKL5_LIMLA|nr:myotubularin-related protein 14 [Limosa lapponica baueri]